MYDKYGDSYFEELDEVGLRDIMDTMEIELQDQDEEFSTLKAKYMKKHFGTKKQILSGRRFFIWNNPQVHDQFEVRFLKAKLESRGALIVDSLKQNFDYMVILQNNDFLDNK